MVHPQDAHVRPAPGAALLHGLGSHIEHAHKADGAGGHAACGIRRARPFCRRRENEKPVPPPDLWMSAAFFTVSKIASMLSSTGSTKQAESCPNGRPAFISVGEFGKKRRLVISS